MCNKRTPVPARGIVMGITVSMIIVGALYPIFMLIFGRVLLKCANQSRNSALGYKTRRSTSSQEAWVFANTIAGRYWIRLGLICLPIIIIAGLFVGIYVHNSGVEGNSLMRYFYGVLGLPLLLFLSVIPYTERKLKTHFS